jgi:hypothetical protein
MNHRPLKYQQYLDKIENCPASICIEIETKCYRWVHDPVNEKDFYPIQRTNQRVFDDSDKECMSWGLSLHLSLISSKEAYLKEYNKRLRESARRSFKQSKGEYIAELNLKKEDGIQSEANNFGHFTFYEYVEFNYLNRINSIIDNFE